MTTDTRAFIDTLRQSGITLFVEGEQLRLRAEKGLVTAAMREEIAARKAQIIACLAGGEAGIAPAARPERIPLSFAQQRLWFLDQLVGPSATYNISSALRIEGVLDRAALEGALGDIVARHEVLRTTFATHRGEPHQVIAPHVEIRLAETDLSHLSGAARDAACERALAGALREHFDLARDPMLRARLIRLSPESFILVLLVHHIAADGWSIGVLVDEVTAFYAAHVAGRKAALPPLPVQYADFALWQRERLSGDELARQLAFWRSQLDGAPPLLNLPSDRPRPARESFSGAHLPFRLPARLKADLDALARRLGTTLYAVLLAGFYTLLQRYSGEGDFVVGSPIANRNRREIEPLVGFFVNTLALRARFDDATPFSDLARQVAATTRAAYDHQDLPFERLVDELAPERDMSHAPLFQTAFALQNAPRPPLRLEGLTITPIPLDNGTSKFDLFLSMHEEEGALHGVWEYATDLFEPASIERFTRHFRALLEGAAADPACAVGELPMLDEAERRLQLEAWNAKPASAETVTPLPRRFEAVARTHPERPALRFEGREMSYGELDAAAGRMAAILRGEGIGRGDFVGICLPRGFEPWITILACWKAGTAYVPLDPAYPPERLAHIVADAGMPLVVTNAALAERLSFGSCRTLLVDALPAGEALEPVSLAHDDLAYVIYTSGSTGRPKGTLLTHGGLGNLAGAVARLFSPGEGDRVLQFASLNFDASAWEAAMALGSGACLQLVAQEAILPDAAFADFLAREGVTHATLPPSFLTALPHRPLPALRELIVAGEAVPQPLIARWAPGRRFTNAYGPTEASVCATAGLCYPEDPVVTIGRPIENARVYILRGERQLLPVGAAGELVIGGLGLAKGYHARPDLDARHFGDDPFGSGRVYRTGDLVRYRPDGAIEFLGRIDHQTKLRGFRIEPGEIEAAIRRSGLVRETLVMAREDEPGEKRLVAYIEPQPGDARAQAERLAEWSDLFRSVYGDAAAFAGADRDEASAAFNIAGWNSVYDGAPIPDETMRDWLDATIADILALKPKRVLEIGCGSGLVLSRVAPHCEAYHGTDLSGEAIDYVAGLKERLPELAHVTLARQPAADFTGLAEGSFDLVVLNSVVQYFPGIDYLRETLAGAARLLAPGGAIFVGDVRALPLMEALHASVQAFRASDETSRKVLRERIRLHLLDEEELHVAPAFFHALARENPALARAEIHLQRGETRNELNAFRYQAILHTRPAEARLPAMRRDWGRDGLALGSLARLLDAGEALLVARIPNARLASEAALLAWLREGGEAALGDCRKRGAGGGIAPQALHALAREKGYRLHLTYSADGGATAMDAAFIPLAEAETASPHPAPVLRDDPDWRAFGNNPLLGKLNRMLAPRLRDHLKASLPDYMIPAAFVLLESFPVTPNGKIDRAALPAPSGESAPDKAHVPPATRAETILAGIWAKLLRRERVGVKENFFEIGGDSIISIQVISRAREAGLHLSPRDLFQHQTIEELARIAREESTDAAEQGAVTGSCAPTPIQSWFFETVTRDPHHFNMTMLVAVRADLDREALARTLEALMRRHDALRSRFSREGESWRQEFLQPDPEAARAALAIFDLAEIPEAERASRRRAFFEEMQASLDPFEGRVMRVGLVEEGSGREKLLFLVVHHLVVDAVSWRILQEDFTAFYRAFAAGEEPAPPAKTTSFKAWSAALARFAASPACGAQTAYWEDAVAAPPLALPRDRNGENLVAAEAVLRRALSPEASRAIAGAAQAAYRARPEDLLIAALAATLAEWTGVRDLRIDLEGHGRADIEEGIDLSRTVGWFTALYPARLRIEAVEPEALIPVVKEQLRAIPGQGIGYGALRHLARHPGLAEDRGGEVAFNYLGQFSRETPDADPQALVTGFPEMETGPIHSPRQIRPYALQVNAALADGELGIRWHYSRDLHDEATIARLADSCIEKLERLVAHCLTRESPVFTPSDFDAASLDAQELDRLALEGDVLDVYDATPLQEGMLFAAMSEPAGGAYVEQVALDLEGALDAAALERAWGGIVARHAVMRSSFNVEGQRRCRQVVRRAVDLPFAVLDWRDAAPAAVAARFEELLAADKSRGFDLARAPLMRLTLLGLADEKWRLLWTSHHILMDGWCLPIVFAELRALYAAEIAGDEAALAPPAPYKNFIRWRRAQDLDAARDFWREDLAGFETPTLLAGAPAPQEREARACGVHRLILTREETAALEANARVHRLTLNTLLQAAWSLMLAHETGASDVVHGTTVSGRPPALPRAEEMVGLFINTLPVRNAVPWSRALAEWLGDLQASQAARDAQGFLALSEIQSLAETPRGAPLFDTLFVFENFPFDESLQRADLHEDVAITGFAGYGETSFPLTAVASAPEGRLALRLTYDRALFDAQRIATLARRFTTLLAGLAGDLARPVAALSPLDAGEREALLARARGPALAAQGPATIAAAFAREAALAPEAIAASDGAARLRYGEIDRAASSLAGRLAAQGCAPGAPVGLLLDRKASFVVGLLGAWRNLSPFVPLDPRWPRARLAEVIAQAGITHVVSDAPAPVPGVTAVSPEGPESEHRESEHRPVRQPRPEDLAYVIFTSGSTGRPKGVCVEHRQLSAYVRGLIERLGLAPSRSGAAFGTTSGFSADLGYTALFASLATGGRLCVIDEDLARDPDALAARLRAEPLDYLKTVPSHFEALASAADAAALVPRRALVFGGEALPWRLVERIASLGPETAVYNHYGLTETTIGVACGRVDDIPPERRFGEIAPLGAPLPGAEIHLLNDALLPAPDGAPGTIFIGGASVSRGYLDRPDLTAEAFLANPFGPGRLYRTGDRARRTPDGGLVFLGRADAQIKIRGYRVEPDEIAAILRRREGVRACIVAGRDGPSGKRLVAWVEGAGLDGEAVRAELREKLPEYMVPAAILVLDALPRLANGKIDLRALPEPEAAPARADAPRNAVEERLAEVFAQVLRRERVGVSENFFDLGGDSIVSIQIVAAARQAGLRLTTRQIFSHQTIAELAFVAEPLAQTSAEQGVVTGEVPLTPIQRRFLASGLADPHHYNQAMIFAVSRELAPEVLEQAFAAILSHHDMLRLRLSDAGENPIQRIADLAEAGSAAGLVDCIDLAHLDEAAQARAVAEITARAQASLDLVAGPITRLTLVRRGDAPPLLHWVAHHLAVDGVSWRVLLEDLDTACRQIAAGEAVSLPPKSMSFRDWARLLSEHAASPAMAAQAAFWRGMGRAASAPLPRDFGPEIGPDDVASAERVSVALAKADTQTLLHEAHAAYNTQAVDLLLCALARALCAWNGAREVLVDLEGHGREPPREDVDISRTVGWFTSLYPVAFALARPGGGADLSRDIAAVKERLREIEGGGLGYGLLRYLRGAPELAAQPAPEVVFNYLGQFDNIGGARADSMLAGEADLGAGPMRSPRQKRPHLLQINALVLGGELRLSIDYSRHRHRRETVERLAEAVLAELHALLAHCLSPEAGGHTPSDFGMAGLDNSELAKLAGLLSR